VFEIENFKKNLELKSNQINKSNQILRFIQ